MMDKHTAVVMTIVPSFWKLYDFDEAVKHYADYILNKLYAKIDRAFDYKIEEKL